MKAAITSGGTSKSSKNPAGTDAGLNLSSSVRGSTRDDSPTPRRGKTFVLKEEAIFPLGEYRATITIFCLSEENACPIQSDIVCFQTTCVK